MKELKRLGTLPVCGFSSRKRDETGENPEYESSRCSCLTCHGAPNPGARPTVRSSSPCANRNPRLAWSKSALLVFGFSVSIESCMRVEHFADVLLIFLFSDL